MAWRIGIFMMIQLQIRNGGGFVGNLVGLLKGGVGEGEQVGARATLWRGRAIGGSGRPGNVSRRVAWRPRAFRWRVGGAQGSGTMVPFLAGSMAVVCSAAEQGDSINGEIGGVRAWQTAVGWCQARRMFGQLDRRVDVMREGLTILVAGVDEATNKRGGWRAREGDLYGDHIDCLVSMWAPLVRGVP